MTGFLVASVLLLAYYAVACLALPMALHAWRGVPRELVRKAQHVGYGLSIWPMLTLFDRWYEAIAGSFLLVVVAVPALLALERWPRYGRYFPDRSTRGGELRRSMLLVQVSFALLLTLFWGLLGPPGKVIVAAGAMGWCFGDAAAALIGKALGRHLVHVRFVDDGKTEEGAWAMAICSGTAVVATLRLYGGLDWPTALAAAAVAGTVASATELVSRDGLDTLTVPLVTSFAVLAVTRLPAWLAGVGAG